MAEAEFRSGPDEDHPFVLVEESLCGQVAQDALVGRSRSVPTLMTLAMLQQHTQD
ncbi:hypothetical protein ABZZ47_40070 [Streptomyces sp. NPDC006465]|uniref:hypothetical protein n=1 Tax=Streptomyces sp. NPDC006465 TaxID=3157174 RepID=UPI0033AA58F0